MSRLLPFLTALLVVGAFAAFFVSFLFAPFAVLALLYGVMIFGDRARVAKKRRAKAAAPVTTATATASARVSAGHDEHNTSA